MDFTIIVSPKRRRDKRAAYSVYDARLIDEDELLCSSNTVFFDAARRLLKSGRAMPDDTLTMRHAGSDTDALRANVGDAARLSIEERDAGPHSVRWVPWKPLAAFNRPIGPCDAANHIAKHGGGNCIDAEKCAEAAEIGTAP